MHVMSEPLYGEIRLMSFNFPPKGWAKCDGQLLAIAQNQALFSLLGTTFGGNGQTTFALPDYRNRTPLHMGGGHPLGEQGGEAAHTLSVAEIPAHVHAFNASQTSAGSPIPTNNFFGSSNNMYAGPANLTAISPETIPNTGGSQPHNNMQPYLVLNFCIALEGIFPSRN